MTFPSKHHNHNPSSSKPPKTPSQQGSVSHAPTTNLNPPITASTTLNSNTYPSFLSSPLSDQYLSRATYLTRQELLKRRSYKLKQLLKCYKDYYWGLMEEVKVQYREYYWKYGVSPFKEEQQRLELHGGLERESNGERENNNSNHNNGEVIGESSGGNKSDLEMKNNGNHRCLFVGCKLKAMALTSFCHLHILSDSKQKLYKPCGYVIKSAQAGPITCGKPILRSSVPSLCGVHFQKAQKHVTRALKKAGLNVSSSSKLAPKFHVIVAEYVRQIQAKRRAAKKANTSKVLDKEATATTG